jgi:3-oxoacyl-[acyl-carrier-protein] synthase-3
MGPFRFQNVFIESMAVNLPETEVTSAELEDQLSGLYDRFQIPFGTLEKLSGVKARRLWPRATMPSAVATKAAEQALANSSVAREQIGAVVNCSVTRDFFEPATACIVHQNLGLPETTTAFDISNACIGFSNGLLQVASMIEMGVIKAGLITSGETITPIIESTIQQLQKEGAVKREELLTVLPTLTLGCGAVAYVLAHRSILAAGTGHQIVGSVARSATSCSDLCAGNADYQIHDNSAVMPLMRTESGKLMASAAKLGGRMWTEFSEAFGATGWTRESVQHIFCHQVGKQVNEGFYREMGLDLEKEFTIYKDLGNLVSSALPACLAIGAEKKGMQQGDKVLLTAFGSGLNSIFTGIVW